MLCRKMEKLFQRKKTILRQGYINGKLSLQRLKKLGYDFPEKFVCFPLITLMMSLPSGQSGVVTISWPIQNLIFSSSLKETSLPHRFGETVGKQSKFTKIQLTLHYTLVTHLPVELKHPPHPNKLLPVPSS